MLQNSVDLDSALTKRLDAFNAIEGNPIDYRVLGQTVSANEASAIIYLKPTANSTVLILSRCCRLGSRARIRRLRGRYYLPGDPGYTAAYDQLPADVLCARNFRALYHLMPIPR